MKQVLQSLKTGATEVVDVPVPGAARGQVQIMTTHTLVSVGTEKMLLDFGKAGWISKARQQPDKVRAVLDKVRTDGIQPTVEAVFRKLDQPLPLGYCNVGVVTDLGAGVTGFARGQRVISNGKHAEMVSVPTNLCARIPDTVSDEAAAFTVVGAIALQGIRLVQPTLGETVVVTGLGLIGLLTVQLLRAQGCRVLGIDFDREKLDLARRFGAEVVDLGSGQDPVSAALSYSRNRGVDAVIVTASTQSSEPMHQAALMCRKRGRIVLVGVAGLELSRDDFFKKELTFQVSASYGPGRYDPNYEEKGQDYPVGFVRWTEQRNFEAVLDMMADGRVDVGPLITHRFSIEQAVEAYDLISGGTRCLGVLLTYPGLPPEARSRTVPVAHPPQQGAKERASTADRAMVSFIGAGNYAVGVLIPAFRKAGARLGMVASNGGVSGVHAARKYGFTRATTDTASLLADADSEAVVITTQHDSHARLTAECLRAGKSVFVEKPLCLTFDELDEIRQAYAEATAPPMAGAGGKSPILMVGFNRRFAPQVQRMKSLLGEVPGAKAFVVAVNAGAIPADHWTQDPQVGGGRIVGEGCHFIDLLRFLAGSPIASAARHTMQAATNDTATINLTFADGSIGTIHYLANGSKAFPKERVEVFASGRVLQLDNFRRLTAFGWGTFRNMNLWKQDKGQQACAHRFVDAVQTGGPSPIPFEELVEVSRVSIELEASAGETR